MDVLNIIANVSIFGSCFSAIIIWADLVNNPQPMKIMNYVWVLTALWASLPGLLLYYKIGRKPSSNETDTMPMDKMSGMDAKMDMSHMRGSSSEKMNVSTSFKIVALSALHCGAGCTLADLVGETVTIFLPITMFGSLIIGQWVFDYILALVFGVGFQYAVIRPMMHLSVGRSIVKAIGVDFFSLTAWQIGMYLFMGLVYLNLFPEGLSKVDIPFWFMMQLAMYCGFILAYPINYILIKTGIKAGM